VPVGRGGERRAISLGNPGLPGDPYTTPTLWAAIQHLAPREDAPEHRHSQSAFRFVLEGEGGIAGTVVEPGHAAVRFTNPTTGGDALTTMRTEMHRLAPGTTTRRGRTSASSVWQVFAGRGEISLDGQTRRVAHGDVIAVPSWTEFGLASGERLTFLAPIPPAPVRRSRPSPAR
jgi:gentisate 1,2-dioxygenase